MPTLGIFINKDQVIQADMGNGAIAIAVQLRCPESDSETLTIFPAEPVRLPSIEDFEAYKDMFYLHLGYHDAKHRVYIKTGSDFVCREYTSGQIARFQNADLD